jgi:hypothetical protein
MKIIARKNMCHRKKVALKKLNRLMNKIYPTIDEVAHEAKMQLLLHGQAKIDTNKIIEKINNR